MTIPDTPNHLLELVDNSRILSNAAVIWPSRRSDDFHHPRKTASFALYERLPSGMWSFCRFCRFSSYLRSGREATMYFFRQARGTSARIVRMRPWPISICIHDCPWPILSDQDTSSAARSAIHREQFLLAFKLAQFLKGALGSIFLETGRWISSASLSLTWAPPGQMRHNARTSVPNVPWLAGQPGVGTSIVTTAGMLLLRA